MLFASPKVFQRIFITGATGAIGQALALRYAAPGVELLLHGRNEPQLALICRQCRSRGAEVRALCLDLTDQLALQDWLEKDLQHWLPDLFIANAGMNINTGEQDQGESLAAMETLLALNVNATLLMTRQIAGAMKARGEGQIALISSLAGFYGLPITPTYSASKAAIKVFGEGMRGWLRPYGVGVTVVMPGYVESEMCNAMPGPKPFLWSPDKAARVIARALSRNRARLSFPFPLNIGTWCLSVLPPESAARILRWLNYSGR